MTDDTSESVAKHVHLEYSSDPPLVSPTNRLLYVIMHPSILLASM